MPSLPALAMLAVLRAKNFILMEELELELSPGLNVLTGETGAGKSIVVGALGLVLGGRASADQVRPGAEEAEVEALFDLDPAEPNARELAVRRVVSPSGRSRAYLNGKLSAASELAELANGLADVASQHESARLTDPSTHIEHLDRFAHLDGARAELAAQVAELEAMVRAIEELRSADATRAEREAFLAFQLQSIDEVGPKPGEVEALSAERRRLRHAGRLRELLGRAAERLDAEGGLSDAAARVAGDLRAAADLDGALAPLAAAAEACSAELRELSSDVGRHRDADEEAPGRLAEIEDRLYRLEGILRRHGPTEADALAARDRIEAELAELGRSESRLAEHERALAARLPAVAGEAVALSERRKRAAASLGAAISAELGELGMGGARVLVEIEALAPRGEPALSAGGARLGRDGIDRVEFLIAPNKGIEPKPLRKIASGGELSRALLALKRVLSDAAPRRLYVFDEVDAGVGGAVAERIGRAIADVAAHHQVLCITHLAQIAAFADAHFVVEKTSDKALSESSVRRVTGAARVQEIARMLSGAQIGAASVAAAEDLLAAVKKPSRRPAGPKAPASPRPTPPQKSGRPRC